MKFLARLLCLCLLSTATLMAQSDTQTFTTEDERISFEVLTTWDVETSEDNSLMLTAPGAEISLMAPDALEATGYIGFSDPPRLADRFARNNDLEQVDFNLFLSGNALAARYVYSTPQQEGVLLVFPLPDDDLVLFDVRLDGTISDETLQRDIEILMATFSYTSQEAPIDVTPDATEEPETDVTPDATDEPEADVTPDATEEPQADATPDPTEEPETAAAGLVAFESEDGTLAFEHDPEWFMGQEDETTVFGFLADPPMSLTIYPPESLLALRYRMRAENPTQFLESYGDFNAALGTIDALEIGEYPAAKRSVEENTGGLFVALQMPGGAFVVAEGFMFEGEFNDDAEAQVLAILETLTYSGEIIREDTSGTEVGALPILRDYAVRDLEPVVNQLRLAGLIPFGGEALFGEDYSFYQGVGNTYYQFSTRNTAQNLVMAGEITYVPGVEDTYEECALSARLIPGNITADAYTDFGLNSEGLAFYRDQAFNSETVREDRIQLESVINTPHHFLIVLFDTELTLFIDGEPVFRANDIEQREGLYAIHLDSGSTNTRCEVRLVRAYELPDTFVPGLCELESPGVVNRRAGAGTEFNSTGQLVEGELARIIGQTNGTDGFLWWQLEDESWVRDDVVNAQGDCRELFSGE